MEYQNTINLLDNTPDEPSKFRTKNSVEKMMTCVQLLTKIVKLKLKFQVYVIIVVHKYFWNYNSYCSRSRLCSKTIREKNEGAIFRICAPFTHCISQIKNAQIDNAKDLLL